MSTDAYMRDAMRHIAAEAGRGFQQAGLNFGTAPMLDATIRCMQRDNERRRAELKAIDMVCINGVWMSPEDRHG